MGSSGNSFFTVFFLMGFLSIQVSFLVVSFVLLSFFPYWGDVANSKFFFFSSSALRVPIGCQNYLWHTVAFLNV